MAPNVQNVANVALNVQNVANVAPNVQNVANRQNVAPNVQNVAPDVHATDYQEDVRRSKRTTKKPVYLDDYCVDNDNVSLMNIVIMYMQIEMYQNVMMMQWHPLKLIIGKEQ